MKFLTHRNILVFFISLSLFAHSFNLNGSISDLIRNIDNLIQTIDRYELLSFLTRFIYVFSISAGYIGLIFYLRDQRTLNKWLMSFILIESYRTITTMLAMLRFPLDYFPNLSKVGFMYYASIVIMIFTLISTIVYFRRIPNIEREYNDTANIVLNTSRRVRLINYITDFLIISGISFDRFYVLKQSMDLKYVFIICFLIYYLFCETLYGRTLGKIWTDTVLIRTKNFFYRITIRTLSRMIPFEQLSFLSKKHPGWHDRFSGVFLYTFYK